MFAWELNPEFGLDAETPDPWGFTCEWLGDTNRNLHSAAKEYVNGDSCWQWNTDGNGNFGGKGVFANWSSDLGQSGTGATGHNVPRSTMHSSPHPSSGLNPNLHAFVVDNDVQLDYPPTKAPFGHEWDISETNLNNYFPIIDILYLMAFERYHKKIERKK